jgi:hypothetical protein
MHFSDAEMDFEHALLYRATFKLEEIRQYQKALITQCKYDLHEAKVMLRDYERRFGQ